MKLSLNLRRNTRGVGKLPRPPTPYPFQTTFQTKLQPIPESPRYINVPIFLQTDMETETNHPPQQFASKEDDDMAGYVIRRQVMVRRHTI